MDATAGRVLKAVTFALAALVLALAGEGVGTLAFAVCATIATVEILKVVVKGLAPATNWSPLLPVLALVVGIVGAVLFVKEQAVWKGLQAGFAALGLYGFLDVVVWTPLVNALKKT